MKHVTECRSPTPVATIITGSYALEDGINTVLTSLEDDMHNYTLSVFTPNE